MTGAAVTARGLEANLGDRTALYLGQPGADLRTRTETALEILARLRAKGEQVVYIDACASPVSRWSCRERPASKAMARNERAGEAAGEPRRT
ncbi:MAG: hypothetical protein MZU79_00825 [Anaerotruncus sp.]|nr:hypothetical protein [Anaerotruncus sp.]